jgi:hypothetical protein
MGSWDCYCALCSGPLGIGYVRLGDSTMEALKKRNKFVSKKKRELQRREHGESSKVEEDASGAAVSSDEEVQDDMQSSSVSGVVTSQADNAAPAFGEETDPEVAVDNVNMEVDDEHGLDSANEDDVSSETSDISILNVSSLRHGRAHTDSMYTYFEEESYDPRKLDLKDVKWLDRCRTLGFNAEALGITKAFISGRGRYDDYGRFGIKKMAKDPNDPGLDEYNCYSDYDSEGSAPTFPFHEECYWVLARHLGYKDPKYINKDVLYSVMSQLSEEYGVNLNLDYGGVTGEQFWSCEAGHEVRNDKLQNKSKSLTPIVSCVQSRHES